MSEQDNLLSVGHYGLKNKMSTIYLYLNINIFKKQSNKKLGQASPYDRAILNLKPSSIIRA